MEEIQNSFLESAKKNQEFFAWKIENGQVVRVPVVLQSIDHTKKLINFKIEGNSQKMFHRLINGGEEIFLYQKQTGIMAATDLRLFRGQKLVVGLPKRLKSINRRASDRVDPLFPVLVVFEGLTKECLDISSGGFSLVINKNDSKKSLKIGDRMQKVLVRFFLHQVELEIELRGAHKLTPFEIEKYPYGKLRLSFQVIEPPVLFLQEVEKLKKSTESLIRDLV